MTAARLLDLAHTSAAAAEPLLHALGEPVPSTIHAGGVPQYVVTRAFAIRDVARKASGEILRLRERIRELERNGGPHA